MSDESDDAAVAVAEPEDAPQAAAPVKTPKPKKVKPPKKAKKKPDGVKKKRGFPIVLLLVPVALVAALVLAFTLPPTHAMIVNSPLKPLLMRLGLLPKSSDAAPGAAKPDPAADVARLHAAVDAGKREAAEKDARIATLTSVVDELQAKPSPTPVASPTPIAVTDDMKRAATYWTGMDPDKAAEIVVRLPDTYVKTVFSQMPPDAVADIMSELPAKTAARLTIGSDRVTTP